MRTGLNNYDEKYYTAMLLFKITWTIFTGAVAIIVLGESSSDEYLWNFITICMATIAVIYATMFNTPEKLKNSSKALKENKILVWASVVTIIIILLVIYSAREFPSPIAVCVYLGVTLFAIYCVTLLDYFFSK